MLLGGLLMARVPPEGLSPTKSRGYSWEVYVSVPILCFGSMACGAVGLYMCYETAFDAWHGKTKPAMDHAKALVAAITYAFTLSKIVGWLEMRGARERKRQRTETRAKNSEAIEARKREFAAMGATILDRDDDEVDEIVGRGSGNNARHEL